MPGHLADKTAFVTAAGQGIGRETALAFAAEGARVIATDVDESKVHQIASESIRTARSSTCCTPPTSRRPRSMPARSTSCSTAPASCTRARCSMPPRTNGSWRSTSTCRSMFRTMQAFLPGMLARGHGVIINMASVASSVKGVPSRFIYSATKAAVIGMTRSVATDYIRQGIRCNCICPGTVHTPSLEERIAANAAHAGSVDAARAAFVERQPMGRLGTPEEIAALAVYLASDAAQFVTGQAVVIDGGLTL